LKPGSEKISDALTPALKRGVTVCSDRSALIPPTPKRAEALAKAGEGVEGPLREC